MAITSGAQSVLCIADNFARRAVSAGTYTTSRVGSFAMSTSVFSRMIVSTSAAVSTIVRESTPVSARIAFRRPSPVIVRRVVNATLPLLSSVFTSVHPTLSTTRFKSAMAMRFALPTLMPRSRAT